MGGDSWEGRLPVDGLYMVDEWVTINGGRCKVRFSLIALGVPLIP